MRRKKTAESWEASQHKNQLIHGWHVFRILIDFTVEECSSTIDMYWRLHIAWKGTVKCNIFLICLSPKFIQERIPWSWNNFPDTSQNRPHFTALRAISIKQQKNKVNNSIDGYYTSIHRIVYFSFLLFLRWNLNPSPHLHFNKERISASDSALFA